MQSYDTTVSASRRATPDILYLLSNIVLGCYVYSYYVFTQLGVLSKISIALAACLMLLVLARGLTAGRLKLPRFWFLPWAFTLYAALSMLWAGETDHALSRTAQIFSAVLGGTAAWLSISNGLTWKPVVWGAVAGSLTLVASTLPDVVRHGIHARTAGIAINSNAAGILLSYVAMFAWCAPVKMPKWLACLAAGILVYGAAFTGSRKVVFCFLALCFISVRSLKQNRQRAAIAAVFAVVIIVTVCYSGILPDLVNSVTSLQIYSRTQNAILGEDSSYQTRLGMYHVAMEMWGERPVLGWGVGQFSARSDFSTYTHSNYVQLLANLGIVGFVLIYSFYCALLLRAYRGLRHGSVHGQSALVLLLMVIALDTSMVSFIGKGSWLLLLFIADLCRHAEQDIASGKSLMTPGQNVWIPESSAPGSSHDL